jgi:hypothetical protein
VSGQSPALARGTAKAASRFESRVREWAFLEHVCGLGETDIRRTLDCEDRQAYRYKAHLAAHPELLADELSHYFTPEIVAGVIARSERKPPAPAHDEALTA